MERLTCHAYSIFFFRLYSHDFDTQYCDNWILQQKDIFLYFVWIENINFGQFCATGIYLDFLFFMWIENIYFGQFCPTDVYLYFSLFRNSSLIPGVCKDFEMQQQYFDKIDIFHRFIFFIIISFYHKIGCQYCS